MDLYLTTSLTLFFDLQLCSGVETFDHKQGFNLFHLHIEDNLLNEHLLLRDRCRRTLYHAVFLMIRLYLPFVVFYECICLKSRSETNLYVG